NDPLDDDERILLRATDLHIALGTRIGEALTIPLDCWIEEDARDLDGHLLLDPKTGQPQRRCGIRYYPEKGYDVAVDWLAEQDIPLARRAVTELTTFCARARGVARWLERRPGRLWGVRARPAPVDERGNEASALRQRRSLPRSNATPRCARDRKTASQ